MEMYNSAQTFGLEGQQLKVYCNVTEYFTDIEADGHALATFAEKIYLVSFERSAAYFTPGLPYVLQVRFKK